MQDQPSSLAPAPAGDLDVERGLVARYLVRVLERPDLPMRSLRSVTWWLNDRAGSFGFEMPPKISEMIANFYSASFDMAAFEKVFAEHRGTLIDHLNSAAKASSRPEPLSTNIEMLLLGLDVPASTVAFKVMGLIACYNRYEQMQYLANAVADAAPPLTRAIAVLVAEPTRIVERLLSPTSELVQSGLLRVRDQAGGEFISGASGRFEIPTRVNTILDDTHDSYDAMRQALLGRPLTTEIEFNDYDHAAADRDLLTAVVKGAVKARGEGVNVLLYGPPGSGKTEMTKLAAREAGVKLYAAGDDKAVDNESDRSHRLADLVFSMRLMQGSENTAVLFDEMEDVAWQLIKRGGSKLYLNRVLETNTVPVFWTSNAISEIDPAVLRRMTLAIELKLPPPRQRERILAKLAARIGVALSPDEVTELSRKLDATPAVLENALKAANYAGGGAAAVERAALGIIRAVSGQAARRATVMADFEPSLACASIDLIDLAEQLVQGGNLTFSLCLSGPPGTGKSAYARYLAGRLGIEVMQKRASDLLGPYVGQSEQAIAAAFEEAREQGVMLIFDEADSLLFDRTQALRSWEVTQVNEMLTWMEHHPWPVVFTTNLMDRIDPASLRRFTFHVRFDYMHKVALKRAYQLFFGFSDVPDDGLAMANLTPGDFAQVRKQARVLGIDRNVARVIQLLQTISRDKPGSFAKIGFKT